MRQKGVDTVRAREAFRQLLLKKIPSAGSKEDAIISSGIAVMLSSVARSMPCYQSTRLILCDRYKWS